jgi:hypothetical protein
MVCLGCLSAGIFLSYTRHISALRSFNKSSILNSMSTGAFLSDGFAVD